MASVGTVYMDVAYNTQQVSKDLVATSNAAGAAGAAALTKQFETRLIGLGDKTAAVGKKMSVSLSLPLVGLGALATKEFLGYEKSLTNIQGLVGASREQTQAYAEDIRRVGVEFAVGAQAAGDALYFITSSGFEGAAAIEVLNQSAKAAASGLGELPVIADLVTSAVTAYGEENLNAAEAVDILTVAVREGKGDPEELAGAMARVLPISSKLGISFDQVAGAFAAMSLTGADANEVATQIRQIMVSLLNPSKQAEDALAGVGLSGASLRQSLAENGLVDTLDELVRALGDDEEATAAVFGNVRALTGVYTILGQNIDDTRGIMDETRNSTGALNDAFEVTEESAAFKLKQSMEDLNDSLIDVGATVVPIITKFAQAGAVIAGAFSALPGPLQTVVVGLGTFVAAAGPVLYVGGKLAKGFGLAVTAAERFAGAGISKGISTIGQTSETAAASTGRLSGSMSRLGAVASTISFAAAAGGVALLTARLQANREEADRWATDVAKIGQGTIPEQLARVQEELATARADAEQFASLNVGPVNLYGSNEGRMKADNVAALEEQEKSLQDQLDSNTNSLDLQARGLDQYGNAIDGVGIDIGDATTAVEQSNAAFDEQRKAVSGLQSVFLGLIDGSEAYQDALDGIGDAQRDADQATRRVASAQRSYQDALRSVTDAQDSYQDSLRGVEDAQRSVTEAQKELDDALNGTSIDDELSLEGAAIRLEEAQQALSEGNFDTDLDRRRAELSLKQAQRGLEQLEAEVAGRPDEARQNLADAQQGLSRAQSAAEDAARGVDDANRQVQDSALAVRDAQYEQAEAAQAIADAQDNAARAALDLYSKQGDLAAAFRDEEGAAADLLDQLLFVQGAYPELAGAMQPYIDKLKVLQGLKAAQGISSHPDTAGGRPQLNAPGRAYGGPVTAGHMYEVLELGQPEMFVDQSGSSFMMAPANGMVTPMNGTGGFTIENLTVTGQSEPQGTASAIASKLRVASIMAGN